MQKKLLIKIIFVSMGLIFSVSLTNAQTASGLSLAKYCINSSGKCCLTDGKTTTPTQATCQSNTGSC